MRKGYFRAGLAERSLLNFQASLEAISRAEALQPNAYTDELATAHQLLPKKLAQNVVFPQNVAKIDLKASAEEMYSRRLAMSSAIPNSQPIIQDKPFISHPNNHQRHRGRKVNNAKAANRCNRNSEESHSLFKPSFLMNPWRTLELRNFGVCPSQSGISVCKPNKGKTTNSSPLFKPSFLSNPWLHLLPENGRDEKFRGKIMSHTSRVPVLSDKSSLRVKRVVPFFGNFQTAENPAEDSVSLQNRGNEENGHRWELRKDLSRSGLANAECESSKTCTEHGLSEDDEEEVEQFLRAQRQLQKKNQSDNLPGPKNLVDSLNDEPTCGTLKRTREISEIDSQTGEEHPELKRAKAPPVY